MLVGVCVAMSETSKLEGSWRICVHVWCMSVCECVCVCVCVWVYVSVQK